MKKHELLEQVYKSNLPSRAKQIMFYLINRANGEGTCFPSIKTIANDCGVSTRTIQRTMVILLEAGFVKKDSRFREKKDISTIPIECHSIFMKLDRSIKNVSCKNLIDNMQCHGEDDNLYPPHELYSLRDI